MFIEKQELPFGLRSLTADSHILNKIHTDNLFLQNDHPFFLNLLYDDLPTSFYQT